MPRSRSAVRGIAFSVSLAGVSLLVSSCTPPMPPDVLAAVAEAQITCQSGDVAVAVPEQFLGSTSAVGASLAGVCPEQSVTEVTVGEPAPVAIASAVPTAAEREDFAARQCPSGNVIIVPAFGYQVTVAFNVIGLEGLLFTPEAIAGVLNGTVTSFEDPLIAGPNEGYDLSGLPEIQVMSLEQPQGAVEAMTAWLAQQVPDTWTRGIVGTLDGSQAFATQQELIDAMYSSDATFAILPTTIAVAAGIAPASLPAYVPGADGSETEEIGVFPDDTQLVKVGAGATTVTVDEQGNMIASPAIGGIPNPESFDLAASKVVLQDGQPLAGWPVVAIAHAMVCDDPANPLPLSFAQYLVRLAGQGSLEGFGLVPLPEPVRFATFTPLKVTVNTEEPIDPTILDQQE